MKRLLILLCALCLLLDLADDGFLGKVPIIPPHSPVNSLSFHSQAPDSDQVDFYRKGNLADLPEITGQFSFQQAALGVQPPRKIIVTPHLASAGGLPW
jgi:hypothetical protein